MCGEGTRPDHRKGGRQITLGGFRTILEELVENRESSAEKMPLSKPSAESMVDQPGGGCGRRGDQVEVGHSDEDGTLGEAALQDESTQQSRATHPRVRGKRGKDKRPGPHKPL